MNNTQSAQLICFAHKELLFFFNHVEYSNKQMAVLLFIWLNARNGQFVKRADICQYFAFSYGRLLYENGSLKTLIDNNLVIEIRNNQRNNGLFFASGLGCSCVDEYLFNCRNSE